MSGPQMAAWQVWHSKSLDIAVPALQMQMQAKQAQAQQGSSGGNVRRSMVRFLPLGSDYQRRRRRASLGLTLMFGR